MKRQCFTRNQSSKAKAFLYLMIMYVCAASLATNSSAQNANPASAPQQLIVNPADVVDWNICNETSFILRLANATLRDGEVKAQGWQKVRPGECLTESVARNAPRFLYAESAPIHRGGIREWKGEITLCAKDTDFSSPATDRCQLNNLDTRNYFAVNPDESTTTLIEPSDFGSKAADAGVQRLLRDAGYTVTAIDGLPGRRTARSLRDFRKAEALEKLPTGKALIDALQKAASEAMKRVGLEICNKSSNRIYTAIGVQENGNWSSRGWWGIDKDACVRPITQSLKGMDAHYYALKEASRTENNANVEASTQDLRLKSIATIPAQFCIAESQFSALGREYCLEGGYGVANFRPLPTDKEGSTVTLTDADFAEPSPTGLRQ